MEHIRSERIITHEDIQFCNSIEQLRNAVRASIARELTNMILNKAEFHVLEDPENRRQKVYADIWVGYTSTIDDNFKLDLEKFSCWEMIDLKKSRCHKCGFVSEKTTNYCGNCGTIMLKKYMQNWVDKIL